MHYDFRHLPDNPHTFLVYEYEGFGVMESPYIEKGFVFSTDLETEARDYISQHYPDDPSTWTSPTGRLFVNSATKLGSKLKKESEAQMAVRQKEIQADQKANPHLWHKTETNGFTINFREIEGWDTK